MKPILIIYATREGQTRHIAEHMGSILNAQQYRCDLVDAAHIPPGFALTNYSAAIVSASLHLGRHEAEMKKFVERNRGELQQMPTLFFSVSLSEAGVEDVDAALPKRTQAQTDVQRTIERFIKETGWQPTHSKGVAGALTYSRYDFATRFVMKRVAKQWGMPTDTSRDYEFTDWEEVNRSVEELLEDIAHLESRGAGIPV